MTALVTMRGGGELEKERRCIDQLPGAVAHGFRHEAAAHKAADKLLRQRVLCHLIVGAAGAGRAHVDLGALGGEHLRGEGAARQEELHAVALVKLEGGAAPGDLHLHARAVDHFTQRDDVLEHNPHALAAVDADGVDLAAHLQRAVHAVVHVHAVLGVGALHHQVARADVVLHRPLAPVLQLHHRRPRGLGGRPRGGRRGGGGPA
mmetsp:Transcript_20564/g.52719  ORF Transcript_20564/g.52719 Transcript_20564/m.52719 type:complete len:205 (-) Transcript_20564:24-638(-)